MFSYNQPGAHIRFMGCTHQQNSTYVYIFEDITKSRDKGSYICGNHKLPADVGQIDACGVSACNSRQHTFAYRMHKEI